jgi:F-type H+-transporting ATPase subunit b
MVTVDYTVLIQIINILVLIGVLNVVLYKPVRTVLAKRQEKMASLDKEIGTFHKNAELRQEEIGRKMQAARAKAKEELEGARTGAQAAGAETLGKIREEANAAKAGRLAEIQQQFGTAREQLRGQVDGFAAEIAGKILGRAV